MKGIYGNTMYARDSDINCVMAFAEGKTGTRHLTKRDTVTIREDGSRSYTLWNTELVRQTEPGKVFVYITDNSDMDNVYYKGYYGRLKDVAMTQTTKMRLNCFLDYFGFDPLEVHSSQKLFGVWHKGKKLKNNKWYALDFEGKELKEVINPIDIM